MPLRVSFLPRLCTQGCRSVWPAWKAARCRGKRAGARPVCSSPWRFEPCPRQSTCRRAHFRITRPAVKVFQCQHVLRRPKAYWCTLYELRLSCSEQSVVVGYIVCMLQSRAIRMYVQQRQARGMHACGLNCGDFVLLGGWLVWLLLPCAVSNFSQHPLPCVTPTRRARPFVVSCVRPGSRKPGAVRALRAGAVSLHPLHQPYPEIRRHRGASAVACVSRDLYLHGGMSCCMFAAFGLCFHRWLFVSRYKKKNTSLWVMWCSPC